MSTLSRTDGAAICLSGLCIIHCLALPVLASLTPVFGSIAENEMIHKALVIATPFLVAAALYRSCPGRDRIIFLAIAGTGIALLFAAAFVHELHDYETPLTVVGALILASAHLFRWRCHKSCTSPAFPSDRHDI